MQKSAAHYTEAAMDEITILKQIAEGDPDDKKCVVKLLDHFKHSGPNGQHVCMVFEYLGDNLLTLIKYSDYRGLPIHMVKEICFHVLVGLDYLHRQLSIIHTDLKPENILLLSMIDPSKDPRNSGNPPILSSSRDKIAMESGVANEIKILNGDLTRNQKKKIRRKAKQAAQGCVDKEVLVEADAETSGAVESSTDAKLIADSVEDHPSSSVNPNNASPDADGTKAAGSEKQGKRRGSRSTRKKLLASVDLKCKLVDFGNACWTYKQFTNDIQTRQYRCPEVILGSKYSTSADLWSFACICFELATGDVLFDPHSGDNFDRDEVCVVSELATVIFTLICFAFFSAHNLFNHNVISLYLTIVMILFLGPVCFDQFDVNLNSLIDLNQEPPSLYQQLERALAGRTMCLCSCLHGYTRLMSTLVFVVVLFFPLSCLSTHP